MNLPWSRLQFISEQRALELWRNGEFPLVPYRKSRKPQYHVPSEIEENVKILGRGQDEEIKGRLLWYATYHPVVWASAIDALASGKEVLPRLEQDVPNNT